jgi:ABC-type antimicrobial peptide transport system permease subunit
VLGQGLRVAVLGAVLGLTGALALTRVLEGLLFGVGASDPATYFVTIFLVIGATLAASYVPAWRAASVDPARALRNWHH